MKRDSRSTGRARAASRPGRGTGTPTTKPKARQTAVRTATSATAGRSRAVRAPRSPRSLRRLTVIGVILVFLAVVITPTLRSYLSQRSQIHQLSAEVSSQQKGIDDLKKQKAKWSDDKYVQAQAGLRLGYVKPGKTLTVYVTDQKQESTSSVAARKNATWYGKLWESTVLAGSR